MLKVLVMIAGLNLCSPERESKENTSEVKQVVILVLVHL